MQIVNNSILTGELENHHILHAKMEKNRQG